jgi:hypothetical protein
MEDVLSVYNRPVDPKRARLCFDERPCQLLDDVVVGLPTKPGKVAKEDNEYVRKGTSVVLLAYDYDRGIRYTQTRKRRTKADYAEFVHHIVSAHYADIAFIDLVQDNLNTHKYGSFYEHLPLSQARMLSRKLVFHFTASADRPKYGSWLNTAEIEFSALARQCLNRRIGSLDELERQVNLWTAERNERAIWIHWSFTVASAEDKLNRWYVRVNPANQPSKCKD